MSMLATGALAQQKMRWVQKNNPNYDERKFSYGFLIGIHTSTFQLKYSDQFISHKFDTVQSVLPEWSGGFSLGFLVNYRTAEYLDLRVTPKVSFYENRIQYLYTNAPPNQQLVETTMVELPMLAKYKSARRGNVRMYMVGGMNPGIEASGKKNIKNASHVEVSQFNLSLEAGLGFDLYYPLFKFSPEIRFSHGLMDVLNDRNNIYGQPLKRLNTNTISVYFIFQ